MDLTTAARFLSSFQIWLVRPPIFFGFLFLLLFAGTVGIGSGLVYFFTDQSSDECFVPTSQPSNDRAGENKTIAIDLSGAVVHPGVHLLPSGSRAIDAVTAAGGFLEEVLDKAALSTQVNLAQELSDADKLHIPVLGESSNTSKSDQATGITLVGATSVNTATTPELEALPEIGSKRAADIIAGRPYQSLQQLVERKVISASLLEKLGGLITL